jgi:arsenate reductase
VSGALNVLFLCTGNSARSILAESTLNALGRGRFHAFSAGSHPGGKVNPLALELLARNGFPTDGARSKSWDEFAGPDAPPMDCIITVCDSAAGESCPVWPGHPLSAHWGMPDPAAAEGSIEEKRRAFLEAFTVLRRRIELLIALPPEKLERHALKAKLLEIGKQ